MDSNQRPSAYEAPALPLSYVAPGRGVTNRLIPSPPTENNLILAKYECQTRLKTVISREILLRMLDIMGRRPRPCLRRVMAKDNQGELMERRPLLMLMDGNAMVHRAYHAIQQPMTVRRTGQEVRGVYGFTNTFLRAVSDWKPTHCAIAFDVKGPTFRHIQYKEYKAQRPPTAPELHAQFPLVRQVLEAFEVPIYEMEGYEADDVIGTLCAQAEKAGLDTIILTGDTDTLQLVSPHIRVVLSYSVQQQKVYDIPAVRERYGGLGPETHPRHQSTGGRPFRQHTGCTRDRPRHGGEAHPAVSEPGWRVPAPG